MKKTNKEFVELERIGLIKMNTTTPISSQKNANIVESYGASCGGCSGCGGSSC